MHDATLVCCIKTYYGGGVVMQTPLQTHHISLHYQSFVTSLREENPRRVPVFTQSNDCTSAADGGQDAPQQSGR